MLRAAYEEGKILWRREPITDFVDKAEVKADTQEKLQLVLAVRKYARDALKLNVGGSYSSYSYVDRPDLTYIVMAAPKTELRPYTWWFPFIGRVPYKGFFSRPEAEAEIDAVESRRIRYERSHFGGIQHSGLVRRSALIAFAALR